jgi:hypothetical protein
METTDNQQKIDEIKNLINRKELISEIENLKFHPLLTDDKKALNNTDDPNIEALR